MRTTHGDMRLFRNGHDRQLGKTHAAPLSGWPADAFSAFWEVG